MYIFKFKTSTSKIAIIKEFIGTWGQFEDLFPKAIVLGLPTPVEE